MSAPDAAARLRAAAGHLQTSAVLLGILGGLAAVLAELSTFVADHIED